MYLFVAGLGLTFLLGPFHFVRSLLAKKRKLREQPEAGLYLLPEGVMRVSWDQPPVVVPRAAIREVTKEVHRQGKSATTAHKHVERYARLGIPEYFIYDRSRERLEAYRLPTPEARRYERIPLEGGRYRSEVLGLEFELAGGKLRLWVGNALLLESHELVEQERRLREEAERGREEAERRLAELQAELERLRGPGTHPPG
ncbi:MAG TPA: Uma2 family endonuclease [Archangium sp.]|nr:Uma2 family endonuclease [Archangium sp.]